MGPLLKWHAELPELRRPLLLTALEGFVDGQGAERLAGAGVEVVELTELAEEVREVNAHLRSPPPSRR